MNIPNSISKLINDFKILPGIGEKSAERFVYQIINMDSEKVNELAKSLIKVKENIKFCPRCNFITEEKYCSICSDKSRDNSKLCIVEDIKSVITFEKLKVYNGKYFVLNKLISPFDKIGPEETNINNLIKIVKNENIEEIILAIKPTIEGEATSLYIEKTLLTLKDNILISKIAHGIPMGVDMEYLDSLTIELAFKDRKKIS